METTKEKVYKDKWPSTKLDFHILGGGDHERKSLQGQMYSHIFIEVVCMRKFLMDPDKESNRSWGRKNFIFGPSSKEAFREVTNNWANSKVGQEEFHIWSWFQRSIRRG